MHLGKIPSTNQFAGRTLPYLLDGGHLWRCSACYLSFRWPVLDKAKLDALYAEGSEHNWNRPHAKRRDWQIARLWLHELLPEASSILDVGCFDGGFLDLLGDTYERYGIEIHPVARQRAEGKGISIIGEDFDSLPHAHKSMDCVTAFDVIEHAHEPAWFLTRCRDMVKPGGLILVSTGNADSPSFRFMGAGYWYCNVAEHLSFINPRWCSKIADELGMSIEKHSLFTYGSSNPLNYTLDTLKNIIYRMTPGFFVWLRQHGLGNNDVMNFPELASQPPSWRNAKDHLIIIFRRR